MDILNKKVLNQLFWFKLSGNLLALLGFTTALLIFFTPEHIALKIIISIAGFIILIHAFKFWWKAWFGFILHVFAALKYDEFNYGWRLTGLVGFVNLDLACYLLLAHSHFSLLFAIAMDLIATGLALYRLGLGVR